MEEEYQDPLVSWDVADKARDIGFLSYCTESFVRTEDGKLDSQYTGLIPDLYTYECYRPSLGQLRKWIGNNYNVEINLTPYSYFVNKVKHTYWSYEVLSGDSLDATIRKTGYVSFDLALDDALHDAIKWVINNMIHV